MKREELLQQFIEPMVLLDHGFVRLVDVMGDEKAIADAARVSFNNHQRDHSEQSDTHLIRYMLRHHHTSPFEQCEIKLHMKLPIFVARQFVRHRTASINEISGRYTVLKGDFYIPDNDRFRSQSNTNKQGSGDVLSSALVDQLKSDMINQSESSVSTYHSLSQELAKETARMVSQVNYYTEWYYKLDLHNMLHFLKLRMDPHAQKEAQLYAEAIYTIIKAWVPNVAEAFEDYVVNAYTLSSAEQQVLESFLAADYIEPHESLLECIQRRAPNRMSKRETEEFAQFLVKLMSGRS